NLPEDALYKIYEMNIDGSGVRRLTNGKYDDFDARYLPGGDIIFLSTRKGQDITVCNTISKTSTINDLPDSYVRCGGGNWRPVPVFTLHRIDSDKNIRPISAFENFEWTPTVADDGRILYTRWDYIDRFNGATISLWSTNTDGTNSQLVYGNFTKMPQAVFEARSIPNSTKLILTAGSHHSNMGGSLVLFDRNKGDEFERPLTRLTPEVCFPETEGWPKHYYANPFPLSEDFYLVAWSDKGLPGHSFIKDDEDNPRNPLGIYLYDAFGNLELLYRDPNIASMYPIPIRPRKIPPAQPSNIEQENKKQGTMLVQNIYQGMGHREKGSIKSIRIIGVPPKTQPKMNKPNLGVSKEDPGKFILGTVPVESDGSAHFKVPAGVPVFFQALDNNGIAVQTMRSLTYLQPGQTLSCIGCHESRDTTPPPGNRPIAATRQPSKITPGPEGSWPLRYDKMVQPVLDKLCTSCHCPKSDDKIAAKFDLTDPNSYKNLLAFADNDLEKLAYEKDRSLVGQGPAANSKLLKMLTDEKRHQNIKLDPESYNRLVTWMDVYAQRQGHFSIQQEQQLIAYRKQLAPILTTE
ncbi:MAG: HzsA-related protein, partial [Planctomycetota bacterium]